MLLGLMIPWLHLEVGYGNFGIRGVILTGTGFNGRSNFGQLKIDWRDLSTEWDSNNADLKGVSSGLTLGNWGLISEVFSKGGVITGIGL